MSDTTSRRSVLKLIALIPSVGAAVSSPGPKRYGRLTVDGHRAHLNATGECLHVWLDGVEVSNVYEADDVAGYVCVYCRDTVEHKRLDARGAVHVGIDGGACALRLTGNVRFKPGPKP